MEVLNKYYPDAEINNKEIAQGIEEVFRDLYNQYLVSEKGTKPKYWDFFDWLSRKEKR